MAVSPDDESCEFPWNCADDLPPPPLVEYSSDSDSEISHSPFKFTGDSDFPSSFQDSDSDDAIKDPVSDLEDHQFSCPNNGSNTLLGYYDPDPRQLPLPKKICGRSHEASLTNTNISRRTHPSTSTWFSGRSDFSSRSHHSNVSGSEFVQVQVDTLTMLTALTFILTAYGVTSDHLYHLFELCLSLLEHGFKSWQAGLVTLGVVILFGFFLWFLIWFVMRYTRRSINPPF